MEIETMTVQDRFALEWNMPLAEVQRLVRLARKAGDCNEHSCNGDRFSANGLSKSDNAELWAAQCSATTAEIAKLIKPYGFTAIEYCGLGPTLKRGEQFVEVPY
jgi:hypothetical protein